MTASDTLPFNRILSYPSLHSVSHEEMVKRMKVAGIELGTPNAQGSGGQVAGQDGMQFDDPRESSSSERGKQQLRKWAWFLC